MRGLPTLVLVIGYPIAEAATLLWFGSTFGWFALLLAIAVGFFLGIAIMRLAGAEAFRVLTNAERRASAFGVAGVDDQEQVIHGAAAPQDLQETARGLGKSSLLFLAGLFLAIPGLISSAVGLVLLLPPVRSVIARRMAASAQASAGGARVTVITADQMGMRTQTWSTADPASSSTGGSSDAADDGAAPPVIQGEILPPPRQEPGGEDGPLSR